ncbi:MAG: hypothetical protein WC884_04025 [Candidatus Paceibacterota bacterium]
MKTLSTNRLAGSHYYREILHEYNQQLKLSGKVNNLKFYREVILPLIPNYHIQSWYQFLHRFKAPADFVLAEARNLSIKDQLKKEKNKLHVTLLSNETATSLGIQRALNIAADRLIEIMENPQLMSAKDAVDLLFKAMKAQDSRIHAIGKIREDNRKEDMFERVFSEVAYSDK